MRAARPAGRALGVLALLAALTLHTESPAALAQVGQDVEAAIAAAAARYGVSYWWLRRVAVCESALRPRVTSRRGHAGLYQYAWPTWRWMSAAAGWAGASPYDPVAAAEVTAWAFAQGYARHWACR